MFPADLERSAEGLLAELRRRGLILATAESCTGGLLAGALTQIAGASDVFERGFVTYSNEAKRELLGVKAETLLAHGAVSLAAAREMAAGALAHSRAALAVSVTGVAGPGGGSPRKPVGYVCFATARRGRLPEAVERRYGAIGRQAIRLAAISEALDLTLRAARDGEA